MSHFIKAEFLHIIMPRVPVEHKYKENKEPETHCGGPSDLIALSTRAHQTSLYLCTYDIADCGEC